MTKVIKPKFKMWKGKVMDQRVKERKNYVGAPSAGVGIFRTYKRLLKKSIVRKKKFRALIWGSTPELRDLILDLKGELVVVDISWEAIQKTSAIMKHQNHPDEIILKANWFNDLLMNNYFDVVLGDLSAVNLTIRNQEKLFKETARLLKSGGFFILRDVIFNPERGTRKLEDIEFDFLQGRIHWFDMFMDFMLYSDVSRKCHNPKTGVYDLDELVTELEKAFSQKRISEKSLKLCSWCRGSGIRVFLPQLKAEKLFKKHFKLIPVKQAKDFKFSQDIVIFFFGRKKK